MALKNWISLTEVEIDHLLTLLRDARNEGSYYGRKDHYWARTEKIETKLHMAAAIAQKRAS